MINEMTYTKIERVLRYHLACNPNARIAIPVDSAADRMDDCPAIAGALFECVKQYTDYSTPYQLPFLDAVARLCDRGAYCPVPAAVALDAMRTDWRIAAACALAAVQIDAGGNGV